MRFSFLLDARVAAPLSFALGFGAGGTLIGLVVKRRLGTKFDKALDDQLEHIKRYYKIEDTRTRVNREADEKAEAKKPWVKPTGTPKEYQEVYAQHIKQNEYSAKPDVIVEIPETVWPSDMPRVEAQRDDFVLIPHEEFNKCVLGYNQYFFTWYSEDEVMWNDESDEIVKDWELYLHPSIIDTLEHGDVAGIVHARNVTREEEIEVELSTDKFERFPKDDPGDEPRDNPKEFKHHMTRHKNRKSSKKTPKFRSDDG